MSYTTIIIIKTPKKSYYCLISNIKANFAKIVISNK